MKTLLKVISAIVSTTLLSGCSMPVGPITQDKATQALAAIDKASELSAFDLDTVESTESDEYSQSFDTSETCNAVGEIGQLVYQADLGIKNKQALPVKLRGFSVRDGILYSFKSGDEYVSLYLTVVGFDSETAAGELAAELKAAATSCGDLEGEITSIQVLQVSELDGGENNYKYHSREKFEAFGVEIFFENVEYIYQNGAVWVLAHLTMSEDGLEKSGLTLDEFDDIIQAKVDQVFENLR